MSSRQHAMDILLFLLFSLEQLSEVHVAGPVSSLLPNAHRARVPPGWQGGPGTPYVAHFGGTGNGWSQSQLHIVRNHEERRSAAQSSLDKPVFLACQGEDSRVSATPHIQLVPGQSWNPAWEGGCQSSSGTRASSAGWGHPCCPFLAHASLGWHLPPPRSAFL